MMDYTLFFQSSAVIGHFRKMKPHLGTIFELLIHQSHTQHFSSQYYSSLSLSLPIETHKVKCVPLAI